MRTAIALLAVLAAATVAVVAEAATASPVALTLRATAACLKKQVYVRLTDGSVAQVTHAVPGARLRAVRRATSDLYLVATIRASWKAVQTRPGQTVVLTADGPAGERWTWSFRLRSSQPLADPTDYVVCLHPRTIDGSFAARMHAAPGDWSFTAAIEKGSLAGSTGTLSLTAR